MDASQVWDRAASRARRPSFALQAGESASCRIAEWFDWWTGEHLSGGGWIEADAPLERIPIWIRAGSVLVTYRAEEIARGLGEEDPSRPLEATLWGEPILGHVAAHLADGTRIAWRRGEWSISPDRPLRGRIAATQGNRRGGAR
jgi:alpha-D-xyloside xylohydrolase